jgi:hypothetical protein
MLVLGGGEFLGELAGECPTDKEMAYFSEMANGEKLWYEGVSPTKSPTRRNVCGRVISSRNNCRTRKWMDY